MFINKHKRPDLIKDYKHFFQIINKLNPYD